MTKSLLITNSLFLLVKDKYLKLETHNMANTLTSPVFTQRKAAVVSNTNASLQAVAAVHNATSAATTVTLPAQTPYVPPASSTVAGVILGETQVTKFEFRQLFTLAERIAVDNASNNTALPPQARAACVTLLKDLEVSGSVDLALPQVVQGVNFLVSIGLLTSVRAMQILSNRPPV